MKRKEWLLTKIQELEDRSGELPEIDKIFLDGYRFQYHQIVQKESKMAESVDKEI